MLRKAVLALSLFLGLGCLSASLAAAEQTGKVWRIGFISILAPSDPAIARDWEIFRQALQNLGYTEGKHLMFERRFAEGRPEKIPTFASELVRLNVDIIVVTSAPAARAARNATRTIPIVMLAGGDPVRINLAASLSHPGGNVTGTTDYTFDLVPKRLELLKAVAPTASHVVMFTYAGVARSDPVAATTIKRDEAAAAQKLGMTLAYVKIDEPEDFGSATAAAMRARPEAIILHNAIATYMLRTELADFALR